MKWPTSVHTPFMTFDMSAGWQASCCVLNVGNKKHLKVYLVKTQVDLYSHREHEPDVRPLE